MVNVEIESRGATSADLNGMKDPKMVVAIDKDEEAPMVQLSDDRLVPASSPRAC